MTKRDLIFNIGVGVILGGIITAVAVTHRSPATVIDPEPEIVKVTAETELLPYSTSHETTEYIPETVFIPYDFISLSEDLQYSIYDLCVEYEISYDLALALIKTESDFQTDIIGDNGQAIGLCQIWTLYWGGLADERGLNVNDPVDNVELMLMILNSHLEACEGKLTEALQMYNTGEPYGDTYASRVYKNIEWIEASK